MKNIIYVLLIVSSIIYILVQDDLKDEISKEFFRVILFIALITILLWRIL